MHMMPNTKLFEPDNQCFRLMQPKIVLLHVQELSSYLNRSEKVGWLEFALV